MKKETLKLLSNIQALKRPDKEYIKRGQEEIFWHIANHLEQTKDVFRRQSDEGRTVFLGESCHLFCARPLIVRELTVQETEEIAHVTSDYLEMFKGYLGEDDHLNLFENMGYPYLWLQHFETNFCQQSFEEDSDILDFHRLGLSYIYGKLLTQIYKEAKWVECFNGQKSCIVVQVSNQLFVDPFIRVFRSMKENADAYPLNGMWWDLSGVNYYKEWAQMLDKEDPRNCLRDYLKEA